MKFRLLGALQVEKPDGSLVPRFPRKIEALLVILLSQANQTVPMTQLIDRLWNDAPPRSATAATHVYISQLRKLLDHDGQNPVVTRAPGYLITLHTDELDLHVFRKLMQHSRTHLKNRRYEDAARTLGTALGMWQGPVLPDLQDNAAVNAYTTWLEELRTECTEMFVETQFIRGRYRETISMLRNLTNQYPLHEPFHQQLITALHRSDRRAEALNAYQRARHIITTELGLEPCQSLQDLHHSILRADHEIAL